VPTDKERADPRLVIAVGHAVDVLLCSQRAEVDSLTGMIRFQDDGESKLAKMLAESRSPAEVGAVMFLKTLRSYGYGLIDTTKTEESK